MADIAIEAIKAANRAINDDFKILPVGNCFRIIEAENGQELTVDYRGTSTVVCINIDKKRIKNPDGTAAKDQTLPFFEASESGILKKNDSIFLCSREGVFYVFLLELKQANSGDYLLQIKSGMLFVQFIFNILNLHEKCELPCINFFGLLCYGPNKRKNATKNPTRISAKFNFDIRSKIPVSNYYSDNFNLNDLISSAKRWVEQKNKDEKNILPP